MRTQEDGRVKTQAEAGVTEAPAGERRGALAPPEPRRQTHGAGSPLEP